MENLFAPCCFQHLSKGREIVSRTEEREQVFLKARFPPQIELKITTGAKQTSCADFGGVNALCSVSQMLRGLELLHSYVKLFPKYFQPKPKPETPVIVRNTLL